MSKGVTICSNAFSFHEVQVNTGKFFKVDTATGDLYCCLLAVQPQPCPSAFCRDNVLKLDASLLYFCNKYSVINVSHAFKVVPSYCNFMV